MSTPPSSPVTALPPRLWIVKMMFVWRWRLGYWDWDAFRLAWRIHR